MRSMADDAREASTERFVGRVAVLDLFDTMLADPASSILWVFGPGGIGKSALTRAVAARAEEFGACVVSVDLRSIEPTAAAVVAAVDAAVSPVGQHEPRLVVTLDTFELVGGLGDWVRHHLLEFLPGGAIVVVAGRHAPDLEWRADPTWSSLLHLHALRALSPQESRQLLERWGLAGDLAASVAPIGRGHPLALVLLAEVLRGSGAGDVPDDLTTAPDLVAGLLQRIADEAPTEEHRRVLDALAMSRVTTRGLVRHLFGRQRADELFEWLRTRSFVEQLADGVCPHDLARDVLEGELRRTDPDAYAQLHRSIRQYLLDRPNVDATTKVQDVIHLHRGSSMMTGYWDWASFGTVEATALRPGDHDQLVEIASVHGDPADLPILRHWLARQPEAFTIVRTGSGEILGFVGILLLDAPSSDDLAVDPVVAAAWRHASRNDPLRPGQVIGVNRFFDDRLHGQSTSPTFNVVSWKCTQVWLTTPGLAWFYISARDEEFWTPMMSYLDFHRVRDVDTDVGDMRLSAYCRDWRRLGPAAWLDLMEARELGGPIVAPPAPPVLVVLSEDDFAVAVRHALRDLTRPDRLATNPLMGSRIVNDQSAHATAADLAEVLRLGLASLSEDPRTDKARRALERTYFHGSVSQEAAAEVLGIAFSTYRRHLGSGVKLLTGALWQWELFGRTR
jgi:hypothetical protein